MRYLGVSDGNMQEGSLRCDVNISVRRGPDAPFGTKVEIKNMNSFSAIQKAIDYEIQRQIKAYETGEPVRQETRLWDESKQLTKSMRTKEGASDYRYFPDPDLGPIEVSDAQREGWRAELPGLPAAKRHRYAEQLGLSIYDARVLTDERSMAEYFEAAVAPRADAKGIANWVTGDIAAYVNANRLAIAELPLKPEQLAELVQLIEGGIISGKIAKEILPELLEQLDVFVKSCGYFPPQNCILDYVNNDDFVAHDESEDESATWPEEEKECQETDSSVTEPSI